MDAILWEYRIQDRKPGTYLALGVGMAACYVVYSMHLAPWVWALVAAYLTLVFIRLSVNRGTTLRVTATRIECQTDEGRRVIPLAEISDLAVDAARPTTCLLRTRDGTTCRVPCADAKRAAHLVTLVRARIAALPA